MTEQELLTLLSEKPVEVEFDNTMQVIAKNYHFTPVAFTVGQQHNQAGENQGSCKLLAFAKLHQLEASATLHLFGKFYREDVVKHPEAADHQNIRNLISHGWDGVTFEGEALTPIER